MDRASDDHLLTIAHVLHPHCQLKDILFLEKSPVTVMKEQSKISLIAVINSEVYSVMTFHTASNQDSYENQNILYQKEHITSDVCGCKTKYCKT